MKPTITPPPLMNKNGFRITLVDEGRDPHVYFIWYDLSDLHRSRASINAVFALFTSWLQKNDPILRTGVVKVEINTNDAHFTYPSDFLEVIVRQRLTLRIYINE